MDRRGDSSVDVGIVGSGAAEAVSAQIPKEEPKFETTIVNRPARGVKRSLKTVVFNARTGAHFDGILARLRRPPLDDADVVMLCEADWRMRRSAGREIAADLAVALGMSFAYGPEFASRRSSRPGSAFLGNAILSSAPLTDARLIALPDAPHRRRSWLIGQPRALIATADFGGRPITLAVAHLHSRWHPAGRAHQMATVIEGLAPAAATILGGDFNTTTTRLDTSSSIAMVAAQMALHPRRFRYPERYEPLFELLADAGFNIDGANVAGKPTFTFSRAIPLPLRPKLDWIALRGLAPVLGSARVIAASSSLLGQRLSDHDFVVCEVRI
jgi:endonuclease/exonuclease/phosphatase family metal-dependent hydrolase